MTSPISARALVSAIVPGTLVAFRGPRAVESREKRVALTFDDGPTPLTRDYLAILRRFDVRATFFLIGKFCARNPELVREIADAGHELGGHGYTHRRFTELSSADLRDELESTRALLPVDWGRRPLVRPPHGAVSLGSVFACVSAGFRLVLWSHDSGDARAELTSEIVRTFDGALEPGSIVLFHEGQTSTLHALPEILNNLRKAGHEFCTVGELLGDG